MKKQTLLESLSSLNVETCPKYEKGTIDDLLLLPFGAYSSKAD
jgi:hypothetical protein